jgi:hypothetical protein
MSASTRTLEVAVLCGLVACGGSALADDEEALPDLEFLEYLGSWEESDEDWLLFNELIGEPAASEEQETNDAEPAGKESTESD